MRSAPLTLIALALHVSILLYIGVVFFLANSGGWISAWTVFPGNEVPFLVMAVFGAVTAFLSLFAPKILKNRGQTASDLSQIEGEPLFFDFSDVTKRIRSITIVRMALAEAVVLYGFVQSINNQTPLWILPFAAVGLCLQIVVGPFGAVFFRKKVYTTPIKKRTS